MHLEQEDALHRLLEAVHDEQSFLCFVDGLLSGQPADEKPLLTSRDPQSRLANQSILKFLSQASKWAKDSKFGMRPGPQPHNLWQQFALFLWSGL
jgi:hypothetical protein